MQLNIDVNLSWPHIDEVAVLPDTPGLTDLDVIDRHIHLVGIEGSYILGNTSDRREDATPVGVMSCDSRFDEVGTLSLPGHRHSSFGTDGTCNGHFDIVVGSLSICDKLASQDGAPVSYTHLTLPTI